VSLKQFTHVPVHRMAALLYKDEDLTLTTHGNWIHHRIVVLFSIAGCLGVTQARSQNITPAAQGSQFVTVIGTGNAVKARPFVDVEESLYEEWEVVHHPGKPVQGVPASDSIAFGNAFGEEPIAGGSPGQAPVTGFHGHRYASSARRNLGTFTGELKSSVFVVRGDVIDFLIGGGRYKNRTCLSLYVDRNGTFEQVRSSTGDNNLRLQRKRWQVSDFKGSRAYLDIEDNASIEPLIGGMTGSQNEKFGFILVDDIRQLDRNGTRVSALEDNEHNFDFERVNERQHSVSTVGSVIHSDPGSFSGSFSVANSGRFRWSLLLTALSPSLSKLDMTWTYTGPVLPGVKLGLLTALPIKLADCQYYVVPDLLYNGNRIGQSAHFLGEDYPENAVTIPAGYAVEDNTRVYGEWVSPQRSESDAQASFRLQKNVAADRLEATYLMPPSIQFGQGMGIDVDQRLTVRDGFQATKTFYIYDAPKLRLPGVSSEKQGYGQVLEAAWKILYAASPTNPPHSLTDDYELRLRSLLDPYTLMQEIQLGGRTYRTWYVGRWELPEDFNFKAEPFVPIQYFHQYTGFSWSGMLGRVSYTALEDYLNTGDANALRLGTDTLDLFADQGMSPLGIIYQVYYDKIGSGSNGALDWWAKNCPECQWHGFGTYGREGLIDMVPLGEELYWYIRSYELLKARGVADKQNWIRATQSSLDKLIELYPLGDVPGRIDGTTGKASGRYIPLVQLPEDDEPRTVDHAWFMFQKPSAGGPEGFIYLIWAYTSYYSLSHNSKYLNYAELLGNQLLSILSKYGSLAGSEMDYFNVDKRMSHAALAAFNDLYDATGKEKWRSAAILGGNAFASWQYAYNVNFQGFENLPLGHFDYRTVGGTPVDVVGTTNNLVFDQGATEFIRLWNATGNMVWFERARALLHQGTESSLTEDKREWLNEHYQGPGNPKQVPFNPRASFDIHSFGGGTEDVLPVWPYHKGNWTTKGAPFLSMYMFAESFDWAEIKRDFGSVTYSFKWKQGGALDTLDEVQIADQGHELIVTARNMIDKKEIYPLRLLDYPGTTVRINGRSYSRGEIEKGIPLTFGPREKVQVSIGLTDGPGQN
jgi:hypothetical protein